MIHIDPRAGSDKLIPRLQALHVPVSKTQLEYGDIHWLGRGEDDRPIPIGIEYKTITDVLDCIKTGRFAGRQLEGMQDAYELSWLLVEGLWKCGDDAKTLMVHKYGGWIPMPLGKGYWTYEALEHWLSTMEIRGGLGVVQTSGPDQSAALIKSRYTYWTCATLDEHSAHLAFDQSGIADRPNRLAGRFRHRQRVSLVRPSVTREMFSRLPQIGWEKSIDVERHFKSMARAVEADEREWRTISGIGKMIAQAAVRILRNGDGW